MCGRVLLATPVAELQRLFGFPELPNLSPRYNIAPTQDIATVRADETGRHLALLRWGLVPHWADDPSIGNRMINARGETVAEKPAFRNALKHRRALILIDGFYEWQAAADGGKRKQPYVIRRRDRRPMALAALWERWKGPKGGPPLETPLETVTIVTTTANATLFPLHDRMPVIVDEADWDAWLNPETPASVAETLIRPAPDDRLDAVPVGPRVGNVRNDDEACIAPLHEQPTLF
ncbi:SOS response-associated peptidase [Azospirillum sp. RWY-5-1]|uniref:Abasic site processing protein n=1 Tax=Azospirillum oleiclasticum TaxID=2735135 RepID=A0ABX2T5H8_9PROT|nr:SOS response-associated peptidase [Azospirillum oleiclasticum]NYZ12338.1 SOS response-associated peptidase [Azospirillum oleiclasticum]NYZ19498.1 SOS response-associated peptidase [Azospirillum oleiclasticum]